MVSVTPYHLPAIILMLLGISALVIGGVMVYDAVPDEPKYQYSVSEPDDPPSDSFREVIQFTDLSETGQDLFLEALNEGEYHSDEEATEVRIGTDTRGINYVEYQDQTYVFDAATNYSGWWRLSVIISGLVATIGLIALLFGSWSVMNNEFKLPTAFLSGLLVAGLLRAIIIITTEPPRPADNPAILALMIPTVGILIWYLLTRAEQHWDLSFSQRMAQ